LMRVRIVLPVDTEVLTGNVKTVLDRDVEYVQLHSALKAVRERANYSSAEDGAGIVGRNHQNEGKRQPERQRRPCNPPPLMAVSFCRCRNLGRKRHKCLELLTR